MRVSTCAHVPAHVHTVSRWLCVRGQSRGTLPLHLRDSFNLPGPLTGNTTHKHALVPAQRHTHTHARPRTHARLSIPLYTSAFSHMNLSSSAHTFKSLPKCLFSSLLSLSLSVCVCVRISDCSLCAHLWSVTLRGTMRLSPALSPSSGAHLC